ncbi:MAG: hypothetical protein ACC656_15580, partial [Candidatus Heimdallarchaeota archaeon]
AYNYDKLIYYKLERIFLISSYWFLLIISGKIGKFEGVYKLFNRILFSYSFFLLTLVFFWKKGRQPDTASIFGISIQSIKTVPYHPKGANITIESLDLIYGTSFPLLNTIYMIMVTTLLLYTFVNVKLHLKTQRTQRAKKLWIIASISHLIWTILALPWFDLGKKFQFLNILSVLLIVIIIIYYPEGLILSKSQILATYHFYDTLTNLNKRTEKSSNISDLAIEHIIEYINSMPSEILDKSKKLEKN